MPTFAANALPPERDESLLPVVAAADRTVSKGTHAAVTGVLSAPRQRPGKGQVTAADFARQIQWAEGYVSQYRNAVPGDLLPFDVRAFEAASDAWLSAREVMAAEDALADSHVETVIAKGVAAFVREIERMQSTGVILGDAGIGKTCALRLVRKGAPRTILVTATKWCEGAAQIAGAIFRAMGMRDGKRASGSKMERVARELAQRPRTVIVDNAHQLSPGALRFLFNVNDIHEGEDRPQCPVVLCGNPEIVEKLSGNDQFRSRLARVYDANERAGGEDFAPALCKSMVGRWFPDLAGEESRALVSAACRVAQAEEGGRFRAVAKALRYSRDFVEAGKFSAPVKAFEKAHSVLKLERGGGLSR